MHDIIYAFRKCCFIIRIIRAHDCPIKTPPILKLLNHGAVCYFNSCVELNSSIGRICQIYNDRSRFPWLQIGKTPKQSVAILITDWRNCRLIDGIRTMNQVHLTLTNNITRIGESNRRCNCLETAHESGVK